MTSYALTEEAVQKIAADHRRLMQQYGNLRGLRNYAGRADDLGEPPILVKNNNGAAVPAFGLMAVTGAYASGAEAILTIDQPSTTFARLILVNDADPIQPSAVGLAQRGPIIQFLADGSPALGDGYGPKASSWTAFKNYPTCLSVLGSANGFGGGLLTPIDRIIGKLAGDLSAGSTATVNIWGGAIGSEAVVSSLTLTAGEWTGPQALTSGTRVSCSFVNGQWYIESTAYPRTVYGTLAGSLSTGGTVTVNVTRTFNGPSPGSTISATDYFGNQSGSSGAVCKCQEDVANGNGWDIIAVC